MMNWMFIAAFTQIIFISFPSYYDEKIAYSYNFTNYFRSLFSVFIFFTTNNSPQMVIAFYPTYKFITTFFLTVVFFNNLLLMGLLIGLSYYKMKLSMANSIEKCCDNKVKRDVFEKLIEHPDVRRTLIKKMIKAVIDRQNQPFLSVDKLLNEQKSKAKLPATNSELIFFTLKKMQLYEFCYSIIDVGIAAMGLYVIHSREFEKYQLFIFTIFLCVVSSLDFVHHVSYWHISHFTQNWKTIFGFTLNLTIIILSGMLLSEDYRSITLIKVWAFACIVKLYRFFLYYFQFDRKKLRSHVLYPFLRYTYDIVMQLFILYIFFAVVGMNLFGGSINDYSMDVYNDTMKTDFDYLEINFNTFLNSLVSLYVITLNDNWPIIANMSIVNKSSYKRQMKFMFVIFKLLMNYVLINSLIAFIIEIFNEQDKRESMVLAKTEPKDSAKPIKRRESEIYEAFGDSGIRSLHKKLN